LLVKEERTSACELASSLINLVTLILSIAALLSAIFAPGIVRHLLAPGLSQNPEIFTLTVNLLRIQAIAAVLFGIGVLSPESPTAPPSVMPFQPGFFAADPGPLRLVGPDLRAVQLVRNPYFAGSLQAKADLPGGFFIAGEWMLGAEGGKDVASFETAFEIAPLPAIDLPASVSASEATELSWDATPYQAGEQLQISLREANPGQTSGTSVSCFAPASSGSIQLHAPGGAEAGSKLQWRVSLDGSPHVFTAPGLAHGQIVA
jgi:hypothetical protein